MFMHMHIHYCKAAPPLKARYMGVIPYSEHIHYCKAAPPLKAQHVGVIYHIPDIIVSLSICYAALQ